MNCPARYVTFFVLVHLLVTVTHGAAHRELQVRLTPSGSAFVGLVIVIAPLLAMWLAWGPRRRLGFGLLAVSMFASLLFGLYHHFLAEGVDHVHSQPPGAWGQIFVITAYGLLITEALGTWMGMHSLRSDTRGQEISSGRSGT
jgi:hypothetical protein